MIDKALTAYRIAAERRFEQKSRTRASRLRLEDGARVAVMGGGPAGSFFAYFLLGMAQRVGLRLRVGIYEPRDFSLAGPPGCNMCAGIISQRLVQNLASEGIVLPSTVVRRGINAYTMHMDVGSARLDAPRHEKRIAAIYRGAGPRGTQLVGRSFDGFLLAQAKRLGANVIRRRAVRRGRKTRVGRAGDWSQSDMESRGVRLERTTSDLIDWREACPLVRRCQLFPAGRWRVLGAHAGKVRCKNPDE